ncbi:MAG: hypothetical protein LBU32_21160 [Clostridiales bacterium]|jgi:hypothetical protein|nr:hypothetical protein [Clostridiales bacterium]
MEKKEANKTEKITLPPWLQKEIMIFFRKTSIPKIAPAKREQQARFSQNEEKGLIM